MNRACECIGIIGTNGTGKTTAVKKLISATGNRALIFTPHDNEWLDYPHNELLTPADFNFPGVCRHVFPTPETFENTVNFFNNGFVVFEEARAYIQANTDTLMRRFLIGRRQKMTDIIFVCHGFSEVPPAFFTFMSRLVLFRTVDDIKRRKGDLLNFEVLDAAQKRVNKNASTNPYYHEVIKL